MQASLVDSPPSWVYRLLGTSARPAAAPAPGRIALSVMRGPRATLVTATVPAAVFAPADVLRDAVADSYAAIAGQVVADGRYPIRFWNFIPSLHDGIAPGLDRYMGFNSGRFLAYARQLEGVSAFATALPAATGVGSRGPDLTIHCLAIDEPGCPIEHPRQIPAYRYSSRYGPHPPSFARATLAAPRDGAPHLLVAGTASVRGEESVHVGLLDRQIAETLANLTSIVHAADAACGHARASDDAALGRYRDVRIYVPDAANAARVLAAVEPRFTGVNEVEVVDADLCRAELLVEIEGVARMDASATARVRS